MNRLRIAVVVAALVIVPLIVLIGIRSSMSSKAAAATVDQQFATWKRSHPGYACGQLIHTSRYIASATCIKSTSTGDNSMDEIAGVTFLDPSAPLDMRAAATGGQSP